MKWRPSYVAVFDTLVVISQLHLQIYIEWYFQVRVQDSLFCHWSMKSRFGSDLLVWVVILSDAVQD